MTNLLNNFCGIDVGCSKIKMTAIVNNQLFQKSIHSGDNFTRDELISSISDFYLSFDNQFSGLGIAFSGVTSDNLSICRTTLPCLTNLSVDDFSHLHCPKVRLINDANATTLAGTIEYPDSKVLLGFTNGTGIGCGIAINGKLFTGSNGFVGEIYGNPIVLPNGEITKIGRVCSGSKIVKKLNDSTRNSNEQTDQLILQEASLYLGSLLVSLIHAYNPDVIYFSGGGFKFTGFLELIKDFIYKHSYPQFLKNLRIVQTSYSVHSGCFGAMKFLVED